MDGTNRIERILVPVGRDRRVSADLVLPASAGERVPALVQYYPYRKDDYSWQTTRAAHERLLEAGFACVLADFVGSGSSPGAAAGAFDPEEGADLAGLVEWLADQPWCNGRVGVWGMSYGATVTLKAATLRPRGLAAIAPMHGSLDPHADWVYPGGCRRGFPALSVWAPWMVAMQLLPPGHRDVAGSWRSVWEERRESVEPYVADWYAHPDGDDPYWSERRRDAGAIDVPALFIGGWRDIYPAAMTRMFAACGGPKHLVMGPWAHEAPDASPFARSDHVAMLIRWFERWLRPEAEPADDGDAFASPVRHWVQGGDGYWAHASAWPPGDGAPTRLHLDVRGTLGSDPADVAPGGLTIDCDPTVGMQASLEDLRRRSADRALDQRVDEERSTTFTTEPFTDDLVLAGPATVTLALALSSHEPDRPAVVVAKLSEVTDERSTLIATGWQRVSGSGVVSVAVEDSAYLIRAGSRLRLSLAGADFPRIAPAARTAPLALDLSTPDRGVLELRLISPPPAVADPFPASSPAPAEAAPQWSASVDRLTGEATVRMAQDWRVPTSDGLGELHVVQDSTATAHPAAPQLAAFRSTVDLTARYAGAGDVEVSVRSEAGDAHFAVHATVREAGIPVFERTWQRR